MNKKEILTFFDSQPIVILSTIGINNTPQTRALVNLRNINISPKLQKYFKNNTRMLFMTNAKTDKVREIRANDAASLYTYDKCFNGMMLSGTITEVLDETIKDTIWDDSLIHYYPSGRHGGDFSVIEFVPKSFKTYRGKDFKKEKGDIK